MSMGKRNGLSRGDARRNARLIRMRGIVRHDRAILAIDLADTKQVLALCDHDSRVLARRTVVGRAREQEDLTRDKSDPKDAVLIGRLVAGLRCYLPERTDQVWARLRQLGG